MTYSAAVLADAPAGYWRFGEPSGTAAADAGGNAITGTYTSGCALGQAGAVAGDTAVLLNGTTGRVELTNNALLSLTTGSVEVWVKTTAPGASYRGVAVKQFAYNIFLIDGKPSVYSWGGTAGVAYQYPTTITDGVWHHLVLTFQSGVAAGSILYLDGAAVGSPFLWTSAASTVQLMAGEGGAGSQYLAGSVDEVAVYPTVLSAARVLAHFLAPRGDLLPNDHLRVECAFTTTPDDPSPAWTDISAWVDMTGGVSITTGRGDEYATVQTGTCRVSLDNTDGRFTPGNVASPYYPNVKIRKKLRVTYFDPAFPAVPHYRFTGYVEEWPTDWPTGGDTYSTAQVTASDRFKRLGQVAKLKSIIEQEYLTDAPAAYFTLGEPDGSTTAGDTSKNGGGVLTTTQVGSGGALTFGANTGPGTDSMPAPAFTPVNDTNGKCLSGPGVAGLSGGATLEAFALTSAVVFQEVVRLENGLDSGIAIAFNASGTVSAFSWDYATAPSVTPVVTSAATFNDGQTHHVALTQSVSGGTVTLTLVVDGVSRGTTTYTRPMTNSFANLVVGAIPGLGNSVFAGTIAYVAAYITPLTVARLAAHYAAGATGFSGERSDQRIARLAGYAGILPAEMNLETGMSTSIAHFDTTGMAPLQAMQDVTATEGGVLFIDGQGLLTFQSRGHRYNAAVATTITAPDTDPSLRFISNDALLVNDVTAGRPGSATVRTIDAPSVADYGTAAVNLTLLTTSDNEVADAANWKANASSDINPRLPNLTMDLLTSPGLAATVLLLGLGSRITLSGLPAQAPASSVDLFIEGLTETITSGGWVIAFNTSPTAGSAVWQLDSALYSQLDVSTRLAY